MTVHYQKLSRLDETFLAFETPNTYMHVAITAVFEAGPLRTPEGGIDIERIRRHLSSRLHRLPRFRQRLAFMPWLNDALWVDDDGFDLGYHVRHASLPRPGSEAQLQRRCAEILERPLDRSRPLWQIWIVEGVGDDAFALIAKVHHCMVDGIGGIAMLAHLLDTEPRSQPEKERPWVARPAPSDAQLIQDELRARRRLVGELGRSLTEMVRDPRESGKRWARKATSVWSLASSSMRPSSRPSFTGPVGPHRRVTWGDIDLAQAKAIGAQLGGTVNDVMLTTVAGGLRRFLSRQGELPPREVKVAVPVSVREIEHGSLGNRASAWILSLPLRVANPRRRFDAIFAATSRLKRVRQADGATALSAAAEWTSGQVLKLGVRLISRASPYHLIVTNVPGPPMPFFLLDSPMRAAYPHLPLFENQGLGIALFSYTGRLYFGLTADWDLLPNPEDLRSDFEEAFEELRGLAPESTAAHAAYNPVARAYSPRSPAAFAR